MENSSPFIGINPIDLSERWFLDSMEQEIRKIFGIETKRTNVIDNIDFAYHEGRDQYYSTEILKKMEELIPKNCIKVIAITNKDLFIPILTYVFGEAQLDGKAAIISLYRLKPEDRSPKNFIIFQERIIKEALHELGHTFGLTHCRDKKCIMHYCRSVNDVDKKENTFCFFCDTILKDKLKNLIR